MTEQVNYTELGNRFARKAQELLDFSDNRPFGEFTRATSWHMVYEDQPATIVSAAQCMQAALAAYEIDYRISCVVSGEG